MSENSHQHDRIEANEPQAPIAYDKDRFKFSQGAVEWDAAIADDLNHSQIIRDNLSPGLFVSALMSEDDMQRLVALRSLLDQSDERIIAAVQLPPHENQWLKFEQERAEQLNKGATIPISVTVGNLAGTVETVELYPRALSADEIERHIQAVYVQQGTATVEPASPLTPLPTQPMRLGTMELLFMLESIKQTADLCHDANLGGYETLAELILTIGNVDESAADAQEQIATIAAPVKDGLVAWWNCLADTPTNEPDDALAAYIGHIHDWLVHLP